MCIIFFAPTGSHVKVCLRVSLALCDTYVDQSKVVFINGELLWTNVFLQSRGIGALKQNLEEKVKDFNFTFSYITF